MINPFKSALFVTYAKERQQVLASGSSGGGGGVVSPQEQLVWVLWKILCGDGDDVSSHGHLSCIVLKRRFGHVD